MKEIRCPNCGEVFQVDESGYAQIVQQVRDSEFEKELEKRKEDLSKQKDSELELIRTQLKSEQEKSLSEKKEELAKKDMAISELENRIKNNEGEKKLAVTEAIQEKERELSKKDEELAKRALQIAELENRIKNSESEKKLAVTEAVREKERELAKKNTEIIELQGQIKTAEAQTELEIKSIKDTHAAEMNAKQKEVDYYKEFKAKQSTKMIGESLEQHCQTSFNQLRMTAFPNSYFEKDNDASGGSKGDFIFRDFIDGIEYISIMFEMKNKADTTATKHTNEHFFEKLDKDRKAKNCEYAVLVSMLEADNEYYNTGIVDVSYRYEKMYVIRPQFFITMITLLRNAARNSFEYIRELQEAKDRQLDITNFESNMETFKTAFGKNYESASKKFNDAINEIDKSIKQLEKVKEALTSSERQLRLANDKAQDLSIKKLTKNAPSVKAMFDSLKAESGGDIKSIKSIESSENAEISENVENTDSGSTD